MNNAKPTKAVYIARIVHVLILSGTISFFILCLTGFLVTPMRIFLASILGLVGGLTILRLLVLGCNRASYQTHHVFWKSWEVILETVNYLVDRQRCAFPKSAQAILISAAIPGILMYSIGTYLNGIQAMYAKIAVGVWTWCWFMLIILWLIRSNLKIENQVVDRFTAVYKAKPMPTMTCIGISLIGSLVIAIATTFWNPPMSFIFISSLVLIAIGYTPWAFDINNSSLDKK